MINNDTSTKPTQPQYLYITAITNAYPMVVTVTDAHDYTQHQLIHFSIPSSYGMFQLNQQTGEIKGVSGLNISVDIDSRGFDVFVVPNPLSTPTPRQYATISPAGQKNAYNTTTIPFHQV